MFHFFSLAEFEEEMGSEEESGKDWSELEEEAARGEPYIYFLTIARGVLLCIVIYCTDI